MPTKKRKKDRLSKDANIAIVGGGLGGLGAALSLRQAGFENVTVYERDASPEDAEEGYGLTLSYNPRGPLAKMNILEQVAQEDCPSRSHYVFSPNGDVLGYYGNAFVKHRGSGQRGNLRVPRKVLRRILLENNSYKVHWGKRFEQFECSDKNQMTLRFQDGSVVENVDLLVGADGIRSPVVKTLWSDKRDESYGLRYMGVMIVLGIADFFHPLLDERGFYTLDGEHRLFTMPYAGSRLASDKGLRRIMWQLSFPLAEETDAKRLRDCGAERLLEEVLRRCDSWHQPVKEMFRATPFRTIWGTGLMDRDPKELLAGIDKRISSRVVVLGDAAHSMSPFKGQGANQSLLDGPLLASWLGKASVEAAVRGFMREMTARTSAKVKSSRQAAVLLHSSNFCNDNPDFAGVRSESTQLFLDTLHQRRIGAQEGRNLDRAIARVIEELRVGIDALLTSDPSIHSSDQTVHDLALSLSRQGDTNGLRNLSLKHAGAIQSAKDNNGRTCLYLSALGGHFQCCRWLLHEVLVSQKNLACQKDSALEAALMNGDSRLISLLSCSGESNTYAIKD